MRKYGLLGALMLITLFYTCDKGAQEKQQQAGDKERQADKAAKEEIRKNFEFNLKTGSPPVQIGDTLRLVFAVKKDSLAMDSLQLYIDNSLHSSYEAIPGEMSLSTGKETPGKKVIAAALNTPYGRIVKRRTVTLASNIVPEKMTYEVVETYPHDIGAYTQGLLFYNGYLYEATGLKGESSVRKVKLENGEVLQSYSVPGDIFGEGITISNGKIIQLSWRAQKGFVYDLETFERLDEFHYSTEGWGLTKISGKLVMSNGTNALTYLDTQSYSQSGRVEVYDNKGPVNKLNELEYFNGAIYANIYMADDIVKIEPKTGRVLARIDMKGLLSPEDYHKEIDVLNGIAYDRQKGRIFVTGKRWPKIYHVKFKPFR